MMAACSSTSSASCSPSKGIVIQLSTEAAESLRSSRQQRRSVPRGEEEDWDDVIPLPSHHPQRQVPSALGGARNNSFSSPAVATPNDKEEGSYRSRGSGPRQQCPEIASDQESQINDDNDHDDNDDDESAMSDTPPPSRPVVLVDLSRLVGYAPQSTVEAALIAEQVRTALVVDDGDFETRTSELFESRLARHSTTNAAADHRSLRLSLAAIDYPENLPHGAAPYLSSSSDGSHSLLSTARLWKRLLRPHPIPIVQQVLDRLRDCDRTLTWKAAMRREIVNMAGVEERHRDWNQWTREGRRADELDKLYRVRDTLQFQVDAAEERVQTLRDAREAEVQRVLAEQRERGGIGGLGTFDLESTLFSFPHTYMGVREEPLFSEQSNDDEEADPYSLLSDYSEEEPDIVSQSDDGDYSNDDESDNEDNDGDSATETAPLGQSDSSDKGEDPDTVGCPALSETDSPAVAATPQRPPLGLRRNRRRRGPHVTRARRERWQDAAREAEHAAHWAEARKAEEAVREACTGPALASAVAVVAALQKRLQQVDDLLESLQDEEWQAAEGGSEDESETSSKGAVARSDKALASHEKKGPTPSVLDDILAMILGATSLPLESAEDDGDAASSGEVVAARRRSWLRSEHRSIVEGWREHFGRVPPPLEPTAKHRPSGPSPGSGTNAAPRATQASTSDNHSDDGVWHLGSPGGGQVDAKGGQPPALLLSRGLPDRVLDDWEDTTDDDDEDHAATEGVGGPPASPPDIGRRSREGLRPGGRAP